MKLRDGVLESSGRQACGDLGAFRWTQVGQFHRSAVQRAFGLAVVDLRQLVAAVEAADQIRLVQRKAQYRTLDAAHDRHIAVVGGHAIVAADHGAADRQPRQDQQHHQRDADRHPSSRSPRAWERIYLWQNTFDDALAGTDRRRPPGGGVGPGELVVVARHRARDDRLGRAVVVVDDVGYHDSHVVGAPAAQRQFDEAVGGLDDVGDLQRFEDGLVADRVGESVQAQQVTVTGVYLPHGQGRLDLVTGQGPHDQRALRVAVRLLPGDAPLVNQGLDKRVVLGDLRQLAVAQQVPARVADVHQPKPVAREQNCRESGAHTFET